MKNNDALAKQIKRAVCEILCEGEKGEGTLNPQVKQKIEMFLDTLRPSDRIDLSECLENFPDTDPNDVLNIQPCLAAIAVANHPMLKLFFQSLAATLVLEFVQAAKKDGL